MSLVVNPEFSEKFREKHSVACCEPTLLQIIFQRNHILRVKRYLRLTLALCKQQLGAQIQHCPRAS